jgi:hypothetical protein
VKGGRKQVSEKDFRIFCRKQVLNGLTIDPSGQWVKGDRSRIGVKHMQAGYKVG